MDRSARSDNATSVDVEIDPHCRRLGRSQTDFALQAIVFGLWSLDFGLWSVRFPPVLVRTGRRLPVQALGERIVECRAAKAERVAVLLRWHADGGEVRRGLAVGRCRASAIAIAHMRAHRAREKNSTRLGRVALTGGPVCV